jgi:hypothetical protein
MACNSGPDIIEDGLVLCLDAGNKRSYPGSGTTWYDTSGNDNHFTLYNTPTFSSDNGGCISFNGTDEYARSTNTIDLSHDGSYIVEAVWRAVNTAIMMVWEQSSNWNTQTAGFGLFIRSNGYSNLGVKADKAHQNHSGRTGSRNFYIPSGNLEWTNTSQLVSSNGDSTGVLVHVDGQLVDYISDFSTSKSAGDWSSVGRNDYIWLGARNGSSWNLSGGISSFKIYKNNKLTTQEVRQNFEATVGRYT